jgi:hypothetical protein
VKSKKNKQKEKEEKEQKRKKRFFLLSENDTPRGSLRGRIQEPIQRSRRGPLGRCKIESSKPQNTLHHGI